MVSFLSGEHFQVSSGKIRSHGKVANAVYNIFDTCQDGLGFKQRYNILCSLNLPEKVQVVKHVLTASQAKIDTTYAKAIAAGYEGLVLKTPDHLYQEKRSIDWQKMKEVQSADLRVVGFFEGKGKYEDSLGGIIVEHYTGVEVKVGGGFSDADRDYIWKYQMKYNGAVAEVLYHEVTPDGSLRHPRFKMWRGDK